MTDTNTTLKLAIGKRGEDKTDGYRTWSEYGESVNGWIMDRDLVEEISEPDQR